MLLNPGREGGWFGTWQFDQIIINHWTGTESVYWNKREKGNVIGYLGYLDWNNLNVYSSRHHRYTDTTWLDTPICNTSILESGRVSPLNLKMEMNQRPIMENGNDQIHNQWHQYQRYRVHNHSSLFRINALNLISCRSIFIDRDVLWLLSGFGLLPGNGWSPRTLSVH